MPERTAEEWADLLKVALDSIKADGYCFYQCCSDHFYIENDKNDESSEVIW